MGQIVHSRGGHQGRPRDPIESRQAAYYGVAGKRYWRVIVFRVAVSTATEREHFESRPDVIRTPFY